MPPRPHRPVAPLTEPLDPIQISELTRDTNRRAIRIDTRLTVIARAMGVDLQTASQPVIAGRGVIIPSMHTTIGDILEKIGSTKGIDVFFDNAKICRIAATPSEG